MPGKPRSVPATIRGTSHARSPRTGRRRDDVDDSLGKPRSWAHPALSVRADPSATTTAAAIPASWETEIRQSVMPRIAAASATVWLTRSTGRPDSSETTRQSCQSMPAGTPRALATASLTANRAASDAGPRE